MASNQMPTEESTYFSRFQFLIIEFGTTVLRSIFDSSYPPHKLQTFLTNKKADLKTLKRRKCIAQAQWEILYPASGVSLSETYDLSLLKCLLRSFCLNENATAFTTGKPVPTDISPEADVVRIGNYRNELAHKENACLSKQEFETKWKDVDQVLCRLGPSIPNLKEDIANLKTAPIDPGSEAKLKSRINFLDSIDRETQLNIIEVSSKVDELTTKIETLEIGQQNIGNQLLKGTPRFETLRLCTQQQIAEFCSDNIYVKTEQYEAAKTILNTNGIVVISGHPGEGKTMMAKQLLVECSNNGRSLIFSQPLDWREVNFELVDAIVIDDIFGVQMNSINSQLNEEWLRSLPQIEILAKNGKLKVVLTTRTAVLHKSIKGNDLGRKFLFQDRNVVKLASNITEKREILVSHLKHNHRDVSKELINQCVKASPSSTNKGSGFAFGFPKCAEMFAAIDELFEKDAAFFEKPIFFFLACVRSMEQSEAAHFLALVLLWANLGVQKKVDELVKDNKAAQVLTKFGLNHNPEVVKKMRVFFRQDDNGFTQLDETSGKVTFNHIVISDGVGIVAAESNLEACLEYSTKEFLMQYITVLKTPDNVRQRVYVPPYDYGMLASKLVNILNIEENKTLVNTFLDILGHDAFLTEAFIDIFLGQLNDTCPEYLFTEPVSATVDVFAFHGFILKKMPVHVAAQLCANLNRTLVFKGLVQRGILKRCMGNKLADELYLSLLFAVSKGYVDIVDCLIDYGCDISEEALFLALNTNHFLFEKMATKVTKQLINKCTFERGNNLMCNAVLWRKYNFVRRIAPFVDLSYTDDLGNTALYYAFLQQNTADAKIVFRELVENGASLDYKYGRHQQTLLHLAVEFNLKENVVLLLEHNARVDTKDRSGKCPIHCAAFQGHVEMAKLLLRHNPHNAALKLTTHAHNSRVKGMTFMHISLWKKQNHFIQYLVPIIKELMNVFNHTDHYGRTVLYCAAFEGESELVQHLLPISDVNKAEKNGFTPLHAAVHRGRSKIARKLYFAGADVNAMDKYGKTPLHVAAERNDTKMLTFLIEHGADHTMRTKRNKTALHILEEIGQKDTNVAASILVLKERDSIYKTYLEGRLSESNSISESDSSIESDSS